MSPAYLYPDDFLKKWNLDAVAFRMFQKNYLTNFLIPAEDKESLILVAFVLILQASRSDIIFKFFCNVVVIFDINFSFIYTLYYFQNFAGKRIKILDYVRFLLAQPVASVPQKTVDRIIELTVIGH